jgi:hypothetical protein
MLFSFNFLAWWISEVEVATFPFFSSKMPWSVGCVISSMGLLRNSCFYPILIMQKALRSSWSKYNSADRSFDSFHRNCDKIQQIIKTTCGTWDLLTNMAKKRRVAQKDKYVQYRSTYRLSIYRAGTINNIWTDQQRTNFCCHNSKYKCGKRFWLLPPRRENSLLMR